MIIKLIHNNIESNEKSDKLSVRDSNFFLYLTFEKVQYFCY